MGGTHRTQPAVLRDGETVHLDTTIGAPEAEAILSARIRWRGINQEERRTSSNSDSSITASGGSGYSVSRTVTFPSVPAGTSFYRHFVRDYYQSQTDGSRTYVKIDWGSPVNNTSTRSTQTGDRYVSATHSYSSTNRAGTSATARFTHTDGAGFRGYVRAYTEGEYYVTTQTDSPAVTVNGGETVSYDGNVDEGEWTSWYPFSSLYVGSNEMTFDISGSGEVEFQVEFEYATALDAPTLTYPTGGETLSGLQTLRWTLPDTVNSEEVFTEIEYSTDAGDTWTPVAVTNQGATSYEIDMTTLQNSGFGKIRIRISDGDVYSAFAENEGIFTVRDNTPPDRPSQLDPDSGESVNYQEAVRLSWQFNDADEGDEQSRADVRWRVRGEETWNDITRSTSSTFYDVASHTFPAGEEIEWQVKTYDQEGQDSAWSDTALFLSSEAPPQPEWVYPAQGETVNEANPIVEWTSSGQAGYRIEIWDETESNLLYEKEQTSTNTTTTIDMALENNTGYIFDLQVRNDEGLWSSRARSNIVVSFTPPAPPRVQVQDAPPSASILLRIDHPVPVEGQPDVSHNRIYRRERGTSEWMMVEREYPTNLIYTDDTPASGTYYEYRVRAIAENGTYTDSEIVSGSVSFTGVWLTNGIDPAEIYQFFYVDHGRSSSYEFDTTLTHYEGRRLPLAHFGEQETQEVSVTLQLFEEHEELVTLSRLARDRVPLLYRDARGRRLFGVVTTLDIEETVWGYRVPLSLQAVQHEEGE